MRIRAGRKAAAAVVTALLLGGVGLAGAMASSASAAVAGVPVVNVQNSGEAGYMGADDGHTHYRFVQGQFTASQALVNLNGDATHGPGAVGVELCNENTNEAAQVGLWWNPAANSGQGGYQVSYDLGLLAGANDDNCIQSGFINPNIGSAPQLLAHMTIHTGDQILLAVYYDPTAGTCTPGLPDARSLGSHGHELQFQATDLSQVNEHRSYTTCVPATSFTEFGNGAVTNNVNLTAPALNLLQSTANDKVNFYSATKASYPISQQKAFYGYGGLTEVQFVNSSGQTLLSPNGSLTGASFSLFEGSTTP